MKRYSRILAIVLAVTLIFASAPAAFAAGTEPGKTATLTFTFKGIYGVDGTFTFSNASILSNVSYSDSGNMAGKVNNNVAYFYNSESTDFTITVKAKVSASAKNGDSCQVTFTYRTSDENGNMTEWKTMTKTIKVEIHTCNDGNKDHKCDVCGDRLSSCNDGNSDHKCDTCGNRLSNCVDSNNDQKCDICGGYVEPPIDYTELDRQLQIAETLNRSEYTADSWNEFAKALEEAKAARKNGKQADVDAAAKKLAEAISKLVKMDYSKLLAALESAKNVGNEKIADLINRLIEAIEAAKAALNSNDQAAVDAAAAALEAVIAELEKALEDMKTTETIDKIVEKEPSYPFCNISWHDILLILLIASVAINVILVIVIVVPVFKKKKQREQEQQEQ